MQGFVKITLGGVYIVVLLYVAWTDIRSRRIPNVVLGPAVLLALLAMGWTLGLPAALLGCVVAPLPLIVGRILVGASQVGMGDIKLAFFIGLVLGYPLALWSIVAALVLSLLVGVAGVLRGAYTWRSTLPFGPYLAAGALPFLLFFYLFP